MIALPQLLTRIMLHYHFGLKLTGMRAIPFEILRGGRTGDKIDVIFPLILKVRLRVNKLGVWAGNNRLGQ